MKAIKTDIDGVIIIEPTVFGDNRGYFYESFSQKWFETEVCDTTFVQENQSKSSFGVLRGLHLQKAPYSQAKLVRVTTGKVLDVAVDVRKSSPTYGKHIAVELSAENNRQLFIPRGLAHGFVVLSDEAVLQYKCDNYYNPQSEATLIWNDESLNIDWKLPKDSFIFSEKDQKGVSLGELKTEM